MVFQAAPKGFHAMKEVAGDMVHAQAEEVANLSAGDEDSDAVCETDDDRAGKIFDGRSHACDAQEDEQDAGHHGAFEEAVNAMLGDDSRHDHYEGAGGAADLCF